MKKIYFMMIVVTIALCMGVAAASAETVSFDPETVTINSSVNEIALLNITIDELPAGLAGYNMTVSLETPAVAEIVDVTFPDWATLLVGSPTVPADSVNLEGVLDLGGAGEDGTITNTTPTPLTLATISVRADSAGTSALIIAINQMDDDNGDPINATVNPGEVIVTGQAVPVAPVAAFIADPMSGQAPLTVEFTDTSTGSPAAWNWSFGDGGTSTEQNPEYTYADPGTYTVNLTVNNTAGADSEEKADFIAVTSAQDGEVDLEVVSIEPNGGYLFANEPNIITATIINNEAGAAGTFTVSFSVNETVYNETVDGLAAGATTDVTITDSTIFGFGDAVEIVVVADPEDAVNETDDMNNEDSLDVVVTYNGYKGARFTDDADIATFTIGDSVIGYFDQRGDLLYSLGDSTFLNASGTMGWEDYTVTWTTADLPIPGEATVDIAWLYVLFSEDKMVAFPDDVTMEFNDVELGSVAYYGDEPYFGTSYRYGVSVYETDDVFNADAANVAVLTNDESADVSIRGMMLVVVYSDETETQKQIFINEGFDLLYGGPEEYTTPEEATAYAPFTGGDINTSGFISVANLITIAPGAGSGEGTLIFNDQTWTDVWSYAGDSAVGVDERDVIEYLLESENEAAFQSDGVYMEASNAFLVVEYIDPVPPVADFEADVLDGDLPLLVNFTDLSTGATEWAWVFGDGATSDEENPSHTYVEPGIYTVNLTVSNDFGSDNVSKSDYITVTIGLPAANFTADPTSGYFPLDVQFTDASIGFNITEWAWDFGDNETSTDQNPLHTFAAAGAYTVSLTVTNDIGNDTVTNVDYITVTEGPTLNIVETAAADGNFTTLVTALELTGLNETLSGTGPFTVFAPTDGAFDALPEGVLDALLADLPELERVLLFHVLGGDYMAADLIPLPSIETVLGENVTLSWDGTNLTVNDALVTVADVECTNGVIHVIDGVLIPSEPPVPPTPTPTPMPVPTPSGGGGFSQFDFTDGNGTILTSSEGKVLRDTTIASADGIAAFTLELGVVALDDEGVPIDEISIINMSESEIPDLSEGAVFTFAGYAYECTPSGAQFTPAALLTFSFTEEEWEAIADEDLTLRFYNEETAEWEEIPVTIDTETRTITAEISHFTVFALFAQGTAPAETPTEVAGAQAETTEPATTADGTTTVPETEPTQSPGFGALLGLIGLGVVALFALRRK
jgi:PGF-CTERM protein